jgi:hypothetical protein
MITLQYIISGKVEKIVGRKTVNKKELLIIQANKYYPLVVEKYHNPKIINEIESTIATIISSDFSIIDYNDRTIDGRTIETRPEIIIEEFLLYTLIA